MKFSFAKGLVVLVLVVMPLVGMEDPRQPLPQGEDAQMSLSAKTCNPQAQRLLLDALSCDILDYHAVSLALEQGANPSSWCNDLDDELYRPPLFYALSHIDIDENGQVRPDVFEIIKLLIDCGADVNADFKSTTPLKYYLSKHSNTQVLTFLLDQGASIWVKPGGLIKYVLKSKDVFFALMAYGFCFNEWIAQMAKFAKHLKKVSNKPGAISEFKDPLSWLLVRKVPVDRSSF